MKLRIGNLLIPQNQKKLVDWYYNIKETHIPEDLPEIEMSATIIDDMLSLEDKDDKPKIISIK